MPHSCRRARAAVAAWICRFRIALGTELRAARESAGKSIDRAADDSGVSRTAIVRIERPIDGCGVNTIGQLVSLAYSYSEGSGSDVGAEISAIVDRALASAGPPPSLHSPEINAVQASSESTMTG